MDRLHKILLTGFWMAEQAARLGITPGEILDAVGRGWFSEDIESLVIARAGDLQGVPLCVEFRKTAERIRNAPVAPMRPNNRTAHNSWRGVYDRRDRKSALMRGHRPWAGLAP